MNKVRSILNIVGGLLFIGFALYLIVFQRGCLKRQTFKPGFNGMVISTLEQRKSGHITVEIKSETKRCFIYMSAIKDKRQYPKYLDSIFKESDSDIMYLKKDQKKEITPLEGIDCLGIDCHVEN